MEISKLLIGLLLFSSLNVGYCQPIKPDKKGVIVIEGPASQSKEVFRLAKKIPRGWVVTTNAFNDIIRIEGRGKR